MHPANAHPSGSACRRHHRFFHSDSQIWSSLQYHLRSDTYCNRYRKVLPYSSNCNNLTYHLHNGMPFLRKKDTFLLRHTPVSSYSLSRCRCYGNIHLPHHTHTPRLCTDLNWYVPQYFSHNIPVVYPWFLHYNSCNNCCTRIWRTSLVSADAIPSYGNVRTNHSEKRFLTLHQY